MVKHPIPPSIKDIDRVQVLQHEYGHFLDYKNKFQPSIAFGSPTLLSFYLTIGIPSIFNAATGLGGNHNSYWTEVRANQQAKTWFGGSYISDEKYFPTK
jgi:hypothetical protein